MDGHRDAEADVARVGQRQPAQPALLGKESEDRDRHGKRDGGVRRRPAPEHPAAQPAESEIMAEIHADEMFRMDAACERLVGGRQQRSDERGLTDGPAGQGDSRVIGDVAGNNQEKRHRERHESANGCRRKHPLAQHRTARETEIKPVKPRRDADERECNEQQMPENYPPLETAEDVFRQSGEELLHAEL